MGATTLTSSSVSNASSLLLLLLLLLLLVCFLSAASPPPPPPPPPPAALESFSSLLFLECLMTSTSSHLPEAVDVVDVPLSSVIYTRDNSSYPAVLDAYVRNLRFNGQATSMSNIDDHRLPFLIVTPLHASHIQSTILCARRHNAHMKIRSGGHDYEGLSYASRHPTQHQPFFLLDMFSLRSIRLFSTSSAWVETGATLGELFYTISQKTNNTRAFPAGICPSVGVGGHLSAGGYGPLIRKYGLSADSVLDAKLVDADGRLLNRGSMGEDLFWAIRGGGAASFGVVLAYRIRLVPVPRNVTVFRVERTADADEGLADTVANWLTVAYKMTDDLFIRLTMEVVNATTTAAATTTKSVRATFRALYLGGNSDDLVSLMLETVPGMGVLRSDCHEMSWAHSVVFWHFPPGTPADEALLSRTLPSRVYLKRKSDYLTEPITKEGIDRIWERMIDLAASPSSPSPYLAFNPYGGRMWDLPDDATPFPHRKGTLYKIQYLMDWTEGGPQAADRYVGLTRDLYAFMSQFVSKDPRASFFNYKDIDLGINTHAKWGYYEARTFGLKYFKYNFHRLVRVKTKVDPTNFFRNEQSIPLLPQNLRHKYVNDRLPRTY